MDKWKDTQANETVAAIDAAKFLPLQKNTKEEREQIRCTFFEFYPRFMAPFEEKQSCRYFNVFTVGHHFDLYDHDLCFAT